MDQKEIFALNLKRELAKSEYNQTTLADKLETSQSNVSKWMNSIQYPRIETIRQIADILNIPIWKLTEQEKSIDDIFSDDIIRLKKGISVDVLEEDGSLTSTIIHKSLVNNDIKAIRMNDNSMNKSITKNSIVFYDTKGIENVKINDIVCFSLKHTNEMYIRRLVSLEPLIFEVDSYSLGFSKIEPNYDEIVIHGKVYEALARL